MDQHEEPLVFDGSLVVQGGGYEFEPTPFIFNDGVKHSPQVADD